MSQNVVGSWTVTLVLVAYCQHPSPYSIASIYLSWKTMDLIMSFSLIEQHASDSTVSQIAYALLLGFITAWLFLKPSTRPRKRRTGTSSTSHQVRSSRITPNPSKIDEPKVCLEGTLQKVASARPLCLSPIAPVTAEDDRPAVCDLLVEHSQNIEAVRRLVARDPYYTPSLHDDLWLLRFVLSNKKGGAEAAAAAASATMKYRAGRGLDDPDYDITMTHPTKMEIFKKWHAAGVDETAFIAYHPHPERELLLLIELARMDQHSMVKNLTAEENMEAFMQNAEWTYQMCDKITRRTGRLTKQARLVDVSGFKYSMLSSEKRKRDGEMTKQFEDFYPQLLAQVLIVNPPTWMQLLWRTTRVFFPKRFVEKVDTLHF